MKRVGESVIIPMKLIQRNPHVSHSKQGTRRGSPPRFPARAGVSGEPA